MLLKLKSSIQSVLSVLSKLANMTTLLLVASVSVLLLINPSLSDAAIYGTNSLVADVEGVDLNVENTIEEVIEPVVSEAVPEAVDENTKLLKKLETEIIPQISSVLTPEQQEGLANNIAAGASFRKAFKSITLTPAQKNKLSAIFKSVPKNDMFATLTPAQKKQLFMQKKQIFMPTAEEIGEKINAGMAAKDKVKSPLAPSTEEIVEKINAKMKIKDLVLEQIDASAK
jgi:hypothetical protein